MSVLVALLWEQGLLGRYQFQSFVSWIKWDAEKVESPYDS